MKKTLLPITLCVVFLSIVIFLVFQILFTPTPIISDVNTSKIVRIQFDADKTGDLIDVDDYNELRILNYLSTCKERRTLQKSGSYFSSDVRIEIAIRTEAGLKQILLGSINYSSYGVGTTKYEILNSNEVIETLSKILMVY